MITAQDIRDRAAEWRLRPEIVEKDYILGWVLAGLGRHPLAGKLWVFKGGTCLKKCYVETFRFSEDLDFSLLPAAPYTQSDLSGTLREVVRTAEELSGIEFPPDRIEVRPRQDKLGRPTFEGRIYYRGPLGIPSYPRVTFDLTQYEPVLEKPTMRQVFHAYPDGLPDGLEIATYSINELLAEKTRALYERTRPRDLYDVVYLLENEPEAFDLTLVRDTLARKCEAKGITSPAAGELLDLIRSSEELRSEWASMLAHQLPVLPQLDDLIGRLPELLSWLEMPAAMPPEVRLAEVPAPSEQPIVAPPGIQFWGGRPLEMLRFAGANRLLVDFTYNGRPRRVEPYSLRRAATGNLLFYGWERAASQIKAFNTAKMFEVRPTDMSFTPRYRVEFTARGALPVPPAARSSGARPQGRHQPTRRRASSYGPKYVFECSYCQKRFRRSQNKPALGKHKAKGEDWNCPGRRGYLVATE